MVDSSSPVPHLADLGLLRLCPRRNIFSACRYLFNCKDALEAEISAILEGLSISIQWSDFPIVIQSDNAMAVAALTDDSLDRSAYGYLMLEIKKILESRGFIPLKIERNRNRVAHLV